MGRKAHEWRRVCTLAADFSVSEFGKVKIVDPPDHRLRYCEASGHPAFTLCGRTYFIADLVARAFLESSRGFIEFADGDKTNVRPGNLVIVDDDKPPQYLPDNMPKSSVVVYR
jgi:hypothetical protein